MHKVCSTCKVLLPLGAFHKNRSARDGYACYCKPCMKLVCERLRETRKAATARSHKSDPARLASWRKAYYDTHRAARVEASGKWQRDNPGKAAAKTGARRATKLSATPAWADLEFIELLYAEVGDLSRIGTRGKLHVDHVVPLQSKAVCGLHVQDNLCVLPARANIAKSNRFWPDMF